MQLTEILEHLTDSLNTSAADQQDDADSSTKWQKSWLNAIEQAATTRINTLHSVDDMAAIAGMSPAHFSRTFSKAVGTAPAQWLRQRRLAMAADLLRSSEMPINDIAAHVGYPRATTFHQVWRNAYDCTPNEWRNRRLGR